MVNEPTCVSHSHTTRCALSLSLLFSSVFLAELLLRLLILLVFLVILLLGFLGVLSATTVISTTQKARILTTAKTISPAIMTAWLPTDQLTNDSATTTTVHLAEEAILYR